MQPDLILHIGTTKTGSTSIQHVFAEHRDDLLAQGVFYPRSPGNVQHDLLAYAVMRNHTLRDSLPASLWEGMAPDARIALFQQQFEAEMAQIPAHVHRVVMSSEFLYIMLHDPAEIAAVQAMLAPWFSRIGVVVYLRRQDAHFSSLYTQILRTGEVVPPEKLKMRARPLHTLDYAGLIAMWQGAFGEEAVSPRLFERTADRRFDVVEDFAQVCGVRLDRRREAPKPDNNPSMDLAGQMLLVDLGRMIQTRENRRNVGSPMWRHVTDAITRASPGRGWRPTRDRAAAFVAQYAAGNEAIRARWFADRASLFSEDFSDLPEQPVAAAPAELYEAACRTILELAGRERAREARTARAAVADAKKAGSPTQLRQALRRLLQVEIDNVEARLSLAELQIADGKHRVARGLLDAARRLQPGHPRLEQVTALLEKAAAEVGGHAGAAGMPAPGRAAAGA